MGIKAGEIVGDEKLNIIRELNKAFADEWLAYYQYWLGAKVIRGPFKDTIGPELAKHAGEEEGHANRLADRIIILGGTPLITPKAWFDETNCGFNPPEDDYVLELVRDNLKGERCAIEHYKKLADKVKDIDPVTWHIIIQILEDETGHEEDLQRFEEDLRLLATRAQSFKKDK